MAKCKCKNKNCDFNDLNIIQHGTGICSKNTDSVAYNVVCPKCQTEHIFVFELTLVYKA